MKQWLWILAIHVAFSAGGDVERVASQFFWLIGALLVIFGPLYAADGGEREVLTNKGVVWLFTQMVVRFCVMTYHGHVALAWFWILASTVLMSATVKLADVDKRGESG